MKNAIRVLSIFAGSLLAIAASANAQTWAFVGAGSSALVVEGGQAAAFELQTTTNFPNTGDTYRCVSSLAKGDLNVIDPTQPSLTEKGVSWIAWSIDTSTGGTTCANPGNNPTVDTYVSLDSVLGNRTLFNGATSNAPNATVGSGANFQVYPKNAAYTGPPAGCAPNGWIVTGPDANAVAETCVIPAGGGTVGTGDIQQLLVAGATMTAAGTDIRPEDALFATQRAFTACGTAITNSSGANTQYLGLGYPAPGAGSYPGAVSSYMGSGSFNIVSFTLPATYSVFRFGAVPIIVHINVTNATGAPTAGGNGFVDSNITNVSSGVLTNFLDGTYSRTQDFPGATGTNESISVLIREPLSGTYNTMEYNEPNTQTNQSSMDVGVNQAAVGQQNCSSGAPKFNPLIIPTKAGSNRFRVIGTGEMEQVMFGQETSGNGHSPNTNLLGWSFWSTGNFQNAYAGPAGYNQDARYLTVDGVDPLTSVYSNTNGTIPTLGNGLLPQVTLTHIIDGSYPIWSFLRLVCIGSGTAQCTAASNLASDAQSFTALGASENYPITAPDFVPVTSSTTAWNTLVVRSHFYPPGTGTPCAPLANGATTTGSHAVGECGGDVGGVVFTIQGDKDYSLDFQNGIGVKAVGELNRRR